MSSSLFKLVSSDSSHSQATYSSRQAECSCSTLFMHADMLLKPTKMLKMLSEDMTLVLTFDVKESNKHLVMTHVQVDNIK